MGAKRAAAAAGAAALVYVALSGRLSPASGDAAAEVLRRERRREEEDEACRKGEERWPERAPASWKEAMAVTARTAGFAYAEMLGKWPIGDIAFGINHYMRIQGNLQHEYTGSGCVPLEGPGVRKELIGLLRYLRLCMFFSKKPYEVFLEFGGYGQGDILIRKSKSKLMKPAFTVVRDESTKCFLLFIRGATSTKDRLTAATAAEVPFHHSVLQDGRKPNLVAGHAHCGMVAAARWIADQAIPCLSKAVEQFPDYRVKVMASSWAPDLQEQIQQTRILGFVNNSMNFMRSHIPFVSNAGSKGADVNVLLSDTRMDELNLSANAHASVQKHSALSCLSSVAANGQTLEALMNPTQGMGIPVLMSTYAGTDQNNDKSTTAGEAAPCSPEKLNCLKSDAGETGQEEKATDPEHMEQLLKSLRSTAMPSHRHQLYPPGRIMHMVVLPQPEERRTGIQRDQGDVVAIYQTPRSMYGKIRLARSMIRDHYMPRYIETMEMLIEKLAEDDRDDTTSQLG
nr:unnamed protein product [Digitaria exilis]